MMLCVLLPHSMVLYIYKQKITIIFQKNKLEEKNKSYKFKEKYIYNF